AIRDTGLPQKTRIHGTLARARERFQWERIEITEARGAIEPTSRADPLVFSRERRQENSECRHHRNSRACDSACLFLRELADMWRVYQDSRMSTHGGKRVVNRYGMRKDWQPKCFRFVDDDC